MPGHDQPCVLAVSKDAQHRFSKKPCEQITLLKGIGVRGDAHSGVTQIDAFRTGLLKIAAGHDEDGRLVRKVGIMGVIMSGGEIRPGDTIGVKLPALPHLRIERV